MRYYDVKVTIGKQIGFTLLCYEDDICIWKGFFKNSEDAERIGKKYLNGNFLVGFNYADAV